jgi:hypothetical protein
MFTALESVKVGVEDLVREALWLISDLTAEDRVSIYSKLLTTRQV